MRLSLGLALLASSLKMSANNPQPLLTFFVDGAPIGEIKC